MCAFLFSPIRLGLPWRCRFKPADRGLGRVLFPTDRVYHRLIILHPHSGVASWHCIGEPTRHLLFWGVGVGSDVVDTTAAHRLRDRPPRSGLKVINPMPGPRDRRRSILPWVIRLDSGPCSYQSRVAFKHRRGTDLLDEFASLIWTVLGDDQSLRWLKFTSIPAFPWCCECRASTSELEHQRRSSTAYAGSFAWRTPQEGRLWHAQTTG